MIDWGINIWNEHFGADESELYGSIQEAEAQNELLDHSIMYLESLLEQKSQDGLTGSDISYIEEQIENHKALKEKYSTFLSSCNGLLDSSKQELSQLFTEYQSGDISDNQLDNLDDELEEEQAKLADTWRDTSYRDYVEENIEGVVDDNKEDGFITQFTLRYFNHVHRRDGVKKASISHVDTSAGLQLSAEECKDFLIDFYKESQAVFFHIITLKMHLKDGDFEVKIDEIKKEIEVEAALGLFEKLQAGTLDDDDFQKMKDLSYSEDSGDNEAIIDVFLTYLVKNNIKSEDEIGSIGEDEELDNIFVNGLRIKKGNIDEAAKLLREEPKYVIEQLRIYYKERYLQGQELENSMQRGLPYFPYIMNMLERCNLSSDLAFLAIAESDFIINRYSGKGAYGAYQIMPGTAKRFGMKVSSIKVQEATIVGNNEEIKELSLYDERRDPILSGFFLVLHLRDLELRGKGSVEEGLRLAAYNGGIATDYINASPNNTTLEGYAKHLSDQIGAVKKITHRVKKGEVLGRIARRYGVSVTAIQQENKLGESTRIQPGKSLIIPGAHTIPLGSIRENLEYPSKLYGIIDALQQKQLLSGLDTSSLNFDMVYIQPEFTTYKVKGGDNYTRLAKRFDTRVKILEQINGKKLQAGKDIEIPAGSATLKDISGKLDIPLDELYRLNPAFLSGQSDDFNIRSLGGVPLNLPAGKGKVFYENCTRKKTGKIIEFRNGQIPDDFIQYYQARLRTAIQKKEFNPGIHTIPRKAGGKLGMIDGYFSQ